MANKKLRSITQGTQSEQEEASEVSDLHYTSSKVIMSPHLPGNLALTLFNITIELSLAETNFLPKDSILIMSHHMLR